MSSALLVAPLEALTDSELSDPERRVLLSLFSFRDKTTNTVWPSVEKIAKRANLKDRTRVSKLTSSLAKKGWLTKKKRGFTGCNQYTLTMPERLSNLDSDTTLEQEATLEPEAKLAPDTSSNLDSDTTSNLDSAATYKEQTNEQTNEQDVGPQPSPATSAADDVFLSFPTNKFATKSEEFHVTLTMVEEFRQLYPIVDVRQQLRNIRGWLLSNPAKRKTFSGCPKFINWWLAKEQNQGGGLPARGPGSSASGPARGGGTRGTTIEHDLNDASWAHQ